MHAREYKAISSPDFETGITEYAVGCPNFSDAELAVLNGLSLQKLTYIRHLTVEMVTKLIDPENKENIIPKHIASTDKEVAGFKGKLQKLNQNQFIALQDKLKRITQETEKMDPRLNTQLYIYQVKNSKDLDFGMLSRIMNEWPVCIEQQWLQVWNNRFIKAVNQCKLDQEGMTIDEKSKKTMRKMLHDAIKQGLNDLCDAEGQIKISLRKALWLEELAISEEELLKKLLSTYLTNQLVLTHPTDKEIKQSAMLQHYFFTELQTSTLRQSVSSFVAMSQLHEAVKKRKKEYGEQDPLYQGGLDAYHEASTLREKIIQNPDADHRNKELESFNRTVSCTAAVMREPQNALVQIDLVDAIQCAPVKTSSRWEKLGAVALFVLGVAVILLAGAIAAYAGFVSVEPGLKIAGACFAAAGALWGRYQYQKSYLLGKSMSKVLNIASSFPLEQKAVIDEEVASVYQYLENQVMGKAKEIAVFLKAINKQGDKQLKDLLANANINENAAMQLTELLKKDHVLCLSVLHHISLHSIKRIAK
ncbi:MAG: hypothetical protein ACD_45C00118G0013 [uncultured bacterium]|nr:MAG: hypothetical protein ACD_45C00118G0013 [uncultured bacterium]